MNWSFLIISIIIILIGSLMTEYNSQPGVPIAKQNENIYTFSILVVSLGVIIMVGVPALAFMAPPVAAKSPYMFFMLWIIGLLLTILGAVAVSINNSADLPEDKSDKYIKISTSITSIGVLFIGYTIGAMTCSAKAPTPSSLTESFFSSLIPSIGPLNITSLF
jgi:hypothetical protein